MCAYKKQQGEYTTLEKKRGREEKGIKRKGKRRPRWRKSCKIPKSSKRKGVAEKGGVEKCHRRIDKETRAA